MDRKLVLKSAALALVCGSLCLGILLSAQSVDGGPYLKVGSWRFYGMPLVETFVFLTTLVSLCWFNSRSAFAASAAWVAMFASVLLGGAYLLQAHAAAPYDLMRWCLLLCVDLASGILFAAAFYVYPMLRRRFKKAR